MTKQLHEQFEPFAPQYLWSYGNSGDVSAWACDAFHKTIANGIRGGLEEDRNVARGSLKRFRLVTAGADQNIGPQCRKFSRQTREARKVTLALTICKFSPSRQPNARKSDTSQHGGHGD